MWAVLIVVSQLITQHVKSIMENPADVAHRATIKTFLVEVATRMGGELNVQEKAACKAIMTEQLTQEHELEAAYRQHVQDIFNENQEEAYRKDTRSVREEVEKRMGQKLSKAMCKACNHLIQSAFKAQTVMAVCSPIM